MAAVKGLYGSKDEFLKQCSESGDSAYSALRSLLERLENPETRTEARVFFAHLQQKLDTDGALKHCLGTYHFQIQDIYLERNEDKERNIAHARVSIEDATEKRAKFVLQPEI